MFVLRTSSSSSTFSASTDKKVAIDACRHGPLSPIPLELITFNYPALQLTSVVFPFNQTSTMAINLWLGSRNLSFFRRVKLNYKSIWVFEGWNCGFALHTMNPSDVSISTPAINDAREKILLVSDRIHVNQIYSFRWTQTFFVRSISWTNFSIHCTRLKHFAIRFLVRLKNSFSISSRIFFH